MGTENLRVGKIKESTVLNWILFFSIFPFFKLVPWIAAEVQPWGGVLGLLYLFLFQVKRDRLFITIIFFLCFLVVAAIISLSMNRSSTAVVLLAVAYALPLFIFLSLKDKTQLLSVRLLYGSVIVYLIIGILQSQSLLVWAEPYMQILIPRFEGGSVGIGGRGVSFLAQEPSGAGFILVLMLSTTSYFYLIKKISGRVLVLVALAEVAMLAMNKSGTAFLLLLYFLSAFVIMMFWYGRSTEKAKMVILLLLVIPLITFSVILGINHYADNTKFIFLVQKLVGIIKANDLLTMASLATLSGGRFVSVLMGYISLSDHYGLLGHGIAAYQTEYVHLSLLANIHWSQYAIASEFANGLPQKPNAYAAQIAMDLGIVGLIAITLISIFCWKQKGKRKFWRRENRLNKSILAGIFATAVFIIYVRSTTAMPVAWVMLAYVHDYINNGIRNTIFIDSIHSVDKENSLLDSTHGRLS